MHKIKKSLNKAVLIVLFHTALTCPFLFTIHTFASAETKQDQPRVVAKVAGSEITFEELYKPIAPHLHAMEQEIYRMKRQQLDQMIAERVLRKEAEQRGVTLQQFVNEEILSGKVEVSDEEVSRYYQENLDQLKALNMPDEEIKHQIGMHLQQQKSGQKVMEYAESLYGKYGVTIHLEEPELPRAEVNVEGSPFIGPPDAPLTIVEFSDYVCPGCRQSHETVKKIREMYGDRVKWVFKDYPLEGHTEAAKAAEAARCMEEQGKFWEYQDFLFTSQEPLHQEQLLSHAKELKVNVEQFENCLQSGKYKNKVERDIEEGKRIGLSGTPTFVIGGKMISGSPSFEDFKEMVDRELKKAGGVS